MKRFGKAAIIIIFLSLLTISSFTAGAYFGDSLPLVYAQTGRIRATEEQPEEFNVFWQAWQVVHQHFVDQDVLDPTALTYGAIDGMLNALGDQGHTTFLTPDELATQREDISGTFFGIGARVGVQDMLPVIIAPFDGSPAEKAGIKAGDLIISVDGEDTSGRDLNDIIDQIRGPEGTTVVLTVLRIDTESTESLDIAIVRGEIKIPATDWTMIPGTTVALLRLSQFNANATDNIVSAVKEAEDAGATALIMDIRNNPGGLLEQAVNVTSQFLARGNVLQEEDARGRRRAFRVRRGGVATEIPMVVLINAGSASSSEIFAGALQDYDRAKLVGDTTFGTGTVLQPFVLDDGSAIMLGTKQWLTAKGRLIRKHGIEPDVRVELSISTDLLSPNEVEDLDVSELLASEDAQLLKALELLDALPELEEASVDEDGSTLGSKGD